MALESSVAAVAGRGGLALLSCLALGCVSNIPGDKHSGKDAKPKGAKEIKLEDGEGRSRPDVITYPGGDRVDWKFFVVPEGPPGTVNVRLSFTPPRPGLDLAFRVYDQYFQRVADAKPTPGSGRRAKTITIDHARPGMKYYVQIYAPRRTDAGEYRVSVRHRERPKVASAQPAIEQDDIPDPPTLPAIPDAPEQPDQPAAQPCPNDPTRFQPDCATEEPQPAAKPVSGRVVQFQVTSAGAVIVTIDRGKNAGVEAGWQGQILNSAGRPLDGGSFTVTKITSGEAIGRVSLSVDQIRANRRVLLSPP